MTSHQEFRHHFAACPLIAIIRGVTPGEVEMIGEALFEGGIRIVEVPLNSPEPLKSIERLAGRLGERMLVGAGTVLDPVEVAQVRDAGGRLVVSPNCDPAVITATREAGLVSCPGFFTPSEAFAAVAAGAQALKLFPAEAASPAVVKAQRAVLAPDIPLVVVGGVTADSVSDWMDAGADGFGLGSALYKPGQSAAATLDKARVFVAAIAR